MNHIQRIVQNTSFLMIGSIFSYIIGFLTITYTARYLGAENFGILSLALAITGLFGVFMDLGLSSWMIREISKDKSLTNKYYSNIAVLKIIFSILTFFLIALVVSIIGYPQTVTNTIYLITLSMIFTSFYGIFNSVFTAYEKMLYPSISIILNSILIFLGILITMHYQLDIVFFATWYIIASLVVLVYSIIIYSYKFRLPKFGIDTGFWKSTIKEAWPFGVTTMLISIYYWIDSLMLSIMVGNEAVGWYNAAYRLIFVLLFIPIVFNTVIFPVMSQFYSTSSDYLKISFEKYFKYITIIAIPIGVGTTLLANKIISLVFGLAYANSVIALQILVWSAVFIFMSGAFARLLEVSNKQLVLTKISAILVIVNIFLNILLIPIFSYVGASIVTVITELLSFLLCVIVVSKMHYGLSRYELMSIMKIGAASIIMGLFIINFEYINLILLIVSAVIIYFITLYIFKIFDNNDLKIFRKLINRAGIE